MTEKDRNDLTWLLAKYVADIKERRDDLLDATTANLDDLETAAKDILYDLAYKDQRK